MMELPDDPVQTSRNVATFVIFATTLEVVLRFRAFFAQTALAIVVIGCISACALTEKEQPMSSDTPNSAPNSRPSLEPAVTVLTEADSGRTIDMRIGEEVLLRLSHNHTWSEPNADGQGVELAPVDYLVDPGFTEWRISATGAGTAVVTTSGTPECGESLPCPDPESTVHLEIRISG
jgi:predicted secreted protein